MVATSGFAPLSFKYDNWGVHLNIFRVRSGGQKQPSAVTQ